mmetsp:Transcript_32487/g.87230  ORF Transcript_32487/g.87230 Transcript_32487/m.87230 type:complete len:204 (+) Transcript_32487:1152-1763(+)
MHRSRGIRISVNREVQWCGSLLLHKSGFTVVFPGFAVPRNSDTSLCVAVSGDEVAKRHRKFFLGALWFRWLPPGRIRDHLHWSLGRRLVTGCRCSRAPKPFWWYADDNIAHLVCIDHETQVAILAILVCEHVLPERFEHVLLLQSLLPAPMHHELLEGKRSSLISTETAWPFLGIPPKARNGSRDPRRATLRGARTVLRHLAS